jgi:Domain of unknown function (DUF6268)
MKVKIILLICFAAIVSIAHSQSINDVTYFNYSLLPQTGFDAQNGNITISRFEFNLATPPIQIGKRVKLINSVYYQNRQFDYSNTFADRELFPSTLHEMRYVATMFFQVRKNWEILAIGRALVRGDLKQSLSGNDFFASGVVGLIHAVKGNQKFKVGVGIIPIDNDFTRNAVLPFALLLYEGKKVKVEVVYPRANFIYKQSDDFEFGLFSMIEGAISHVSPFAINNETTEYFRTFQLVVAPSVSHRLYKSLFAHLKVGYATLRSFELLDGDLESLKNQNHDIKSSLYIRAGVSLRVPMTQQ